MEEMISIPPAIQMAGSGAGRVAEVRPDLSEGIALIASLALVGIRVTESMAAVVSGPAVLTKANQRRRAPVFSARLRRLHRTGRSRCPRSWLVLSPSICESLENAPSDSSSRRRPAPRCIGTDGQKFGIGRFDRSKVSPSGPPSTTCATSMRRCLSGMANRSRWSRLA